MRRDKYFIFDLPGYFFCQYLQTGIIVRKQLIEFNLNGHIIIGESNPVNVGGSGGDAGTGVAASETLYGDVNVDGSVDNLDVTLINKYLLGTAKLSEQGKKNADVDANGTIDTTDSLNILKCCLELIEQSEFPIK